jgi:RHS repeat-associated protein
MRRWRVAPNGTPRHMGTDIRYFAVDGLGSIVVRSDGDGNVLDSAAYSPWGDGTSSLFGYTGRETFDGGLLYYRARNYHPSLGRFLSEDPLLGALGRNNVTALESSQPYAYVHSEPTSRRDPLGLKDCGAYPVLTNPCGAGCLARFQWSLCGLQQTMFWGHVAEVGLTAIAFVGGLRVAGVAGAGAAAAITLTVSALYLHHVQIGAEAAFTNEYKACLGACKAMSCPFSPRGPFMAGN